MAAATAAVQMHTHSSAQTARTRLRPLTPGAAFNEIKANLLRNQANSSSSPFVALV